MSLKRASPVDLKKYGGKWFEVASFPAWFSKDCVSVEAEYTEKERFIEVKNSCETEKVTEEHVCSGEGERQVCMIDRKPVVRVKVGKAFKTPMDNVLKVQFTFPFRADYEIIFVDTGYKYAVVGSSGKRYLWILARDVPVKGKIFQFLSDEAVRAGYDVETISSRLKITAKNVDWE